MIELNQAILGLFKLYNYFLTSLWFFNASIGHAFTLRGDGHFLFLLTWFSERRKGYYSFRKDKERIVLFAKTALFKLLLSL